MKLKHVFRLIGDPDVGHALDLVFTLLKIRLLVLLGVPSHARGLLNFASLFELVVDRLCS